MISVAGSEVGGALKRGLKERRTLFVCPAAYTYIPRSTIFRKKREFCLPCARLGPGSVGRDSAYPTLARWGAYRPMGIEIAIFYQGIFHKDSQISFDFIRLRKFLNTLRLEFR